MDWFFFSAAYAAIVMVGAVILRVTARRRKEIGKLYRAHFEDEIIVKSHMDKPTRRNHGN